MDDRDRDILAFESKWWQQRGNKEAEIRRLFDMSAIRYAQCLNRVIDNPEALQFDPILVNRLRRIRDEREIGRQRRRES